MIRLHATKKEAKIQNCMLISIPSFSIQNIYIHIYTFPSTSQEFHVAIASENCVQPPLLRSSLSVSFTLLL